MPQHCIRGNASIRNPYISYILILREIQNVLRGNKRDIHINENLFQYKRNSVAACKKFEAHKKFFYLFHLYGNSLFVLTSFSLSLLSQNIVPSGKTLLKHARKLYKALKVYIYIYSKNNKSFNIRVSVGKPKPLNTKLTVFSTSLCVPHTSKQTGLYHSSPSKFSMWRKTAMWLRERNWIISARSEWIRGHRSICFKTERKKST